MPLNGLGLMVEFNLGLESQGKVREFHIFWKLATLLTNPFFMVLSSFVRRHDRSFVVHLLEPAINRCLYGDLYNLGVQYRYGRF